MLPALYPFDSREKWLEYANRFLIHSERDREIVTMLVERSLIPVLRGPEIAFYLGVSPKLVSYMVKRPHKYYRSFQVPKRNGSSREITAPRVFLKTVQRYILDCILSQVSVSKVAFGFKRGCNCGTGALIHVGKRFLWNIDLQDFFPSISKSTVRSVFLKLGYPDPAAYFLAGLCCLDEQLPQGAPTSPTISNIVFRSLDETLEALSAHHTITYGRYADDLSFSSQQPIPEVFRNEVKRQLNVNGFRIQPNKSRLMGPGVRREVTGLTINNSVSIPRDKRRKFRAFFHRVSQNPADYIKVKSQAIGYASWIHDYHPNEGTNYLAAARRIPDRQDE